MSPGRLRPGFSSSYGYIGFLISWMSAHNPVLIGLSCRSAPVITSGRDVLQITQKPAGCSCKHPDGPHPICSARTARQKGRRNMSTSFLKACCPNAVLSGTSILYANRGRGDRRALGNVNLD